MKLEANQQKIDCMIHNHPNPKIQMLTVAVVQVPSLGARGCFDWEMF